MGVSCASYLYLTCKDLCHWGLHPVLTRMALKREREKKRETFRIDKMLISTGKLCKIWQTHYEYSKLSFVLYNILQNLQSLAKQNFSPLIVFMSFL